MIRAALVLPPALVFAWFAYKDALVHLRGRRVSRVESLIHLGLGISELSLIAGAMIGDPALLAGGAAATASLGAWDEYGWHRALPPEEADYHAKGHLALFMVLAASLLVPLVEAHARR